MSYWRKELTNEFANESNKVPTNDIYIYISVYVSSWITELWN